MEFKIIDTRTIAGLKEAERLKNNGWEIGSVGLYTIEFFRSKQSLEMLARQKLSTMLNEKGKRLIWGIDSIKNRCGKYTYVFASQEYQPFKLVVTI